MSIIDKYETSEHRNNIAHFAAIVNLAKSDGAINDEEEVIIKGFASKLNISQQEYVEILKNPGVYPINPPNTIGERLERIYDLFKIIYADHLIEDAERALIYKYAIGLGCSGERANEVIKKSIKIFGGNIDFDDYQYLINKQ
tara:strand:- start:26095 stop:26520 length:426 start_codon:yes stop_codon:yes gene_type:complete